MKWRGISSGTKRLLVVSGVLAFGLFLTIISFLLRSDRTSTEGMIHDREQTPTQRPSQTLDRGRIGTEQSISQGASTWTGILIDSGCPDLDRANLRAAPGENMAQQPGAPAAQTTRAEGIDVSAATAQSERADALEHQTPDLRARNQDFGCAITGVTRGFALYLPDGQVKDLDQGGNTQALVAFQGTATGQAVMNGRALGAKPRAAVTGIGSGDRIIVESIRLM